MAKKKQRKVVKYRKPRNLNTDMIVFAITFVCIFFSVSIHLRKKKIQFYEVTEDPIINDGTYAGLIIREEDTEYAAGSDNTSYYIREGKRVAVGTDIYPIDENGTLSQALADSASVNLNLTDTNLVDIKKQLTSFSVVYQDRNFSSVRGVKCSLGVTVLEYVNLNILDDLEQLMKAVGVNFAQMRVPKSGIISYAIDSLEDFDISQTSEAAFDRTNYSRVITKSGRLAEKGAPAHKIVTDEDWSLVFPMSEQDAVNYGTQTSLKMFFSAENLTCWGDFSMPTRMDAKSYGRLDFNRHMVQFVADRYLDFETMSSKVEGLKTSVNSVTSKSFYLVPVDYLTTGKDNTDNGLYKEVYSKSGTGIVFVPATPYNFTEEYYYIGIGDEEGGLKTGDYIMEPDSPTERYQVGATSSLQGAYNTSRSYAVSKWIVVLAQNDEHYIVKKGTNYDLSAYDHIAMNASLIENEDALICQ